MRLTVCGRSASVSCCTVVAANAMWLILRGVNCVALDSDKGACFSW